MAAFYHSRVVLCHISEWRRFFIAGVVSAIYPSGGVFFIAGVFFAIYPSSGFFDSRGVLCPISEWRRFSAIYVSETLF